MSQERRVVAALRHLAGGPLSSDDNFVIWASWLRNTPVVPWLCTSREDAIGMDTTGVDLGRGAKRRVGFGWRSALIKAAATVLIAVGLLALIRFVFL